MKEDKNKIIWGSGILIAGFLMLLKFNFNVDFSYVLSWPWMQIIPTIVLLIGSWIVVDGINENKK